ncbi:MAG: DUF2793 domain-containing protein, partial [Alphaproteobacteria bacterium]|nr:DUF2793 domain-containing protein [Alphaproteobacteria bacterium]
NLALAYLVAAQAQKEITHNDALNDLDFLTQISVLDRTLSVPPSAPSTGDVYIVGDSPSGAWTGCAGKIAAYYSGWKFKTPVTGWRAWVRDENKAVYYNGSGWKLLDAPFLDATFSWNPGTVSSGSGISSSAVTVTGAALGDFAQVAAPYDLQGVMATAYVSAADTVIVRIQNNTGSSVSLASGTWRIRVAKA